MRSHDDGSRNERESDDGLNYWGDSKAPTTPTKKNLVYNQTTQRPIAIELKLPNSLPRNPENPSVKNQGTSQLHNIISSQRQYSNKPQVEQGLTAYESRDKEKAFENTTSPKPYEEYFTKSDGRSSHPHHSRFRPAYRTPENIFEAEEISQARRESDEQTRQPLQAVQIRQGATRKHDNLERKLEQQTSLTPDSVRLAHGHHREVDEATNPWFSIRLQARRDVAEPTPTAGAADQKTVALS
ncbi:hypothetical protein DY000_02056542 [Brassica cretica]|uniref:DUF4005 domain-containing protein n=1 Tax=Brassica cretica TaxID=69181 RepID=A0ABQ7A868_BRACR|nr:hypothetical protein DY000_02056542 [Brassica cretica]